MSRWIGISGSRTIRSGTRQTHRADRANLERLLTVRCLHLDQNFIRLDRFSISVQPIYHK